MDKWTNSITVSDWYTDTYTYSYPSNTTAYVKAAWKQCKYGGTSSFITEHDSYSRVPQVPSKLGAGKKQIELPDGAILHIDDDGNYHIDDKDAKVIYKANRIREFSPHLNASDMLAQFIEYIGTLGRINQEEALALPIKHFISWLIISAAERDGDQVPTDIVPVSRQLLKPRCFKCGRYIPRFHTHVKFPFCSLEHARFALTLPSA